MSKREERMGAVVGVPEASCGGWMIKWPYAAMVTVEAARRAVALTGAATRAPEKALRWGLTAGARTAAKDAAARVDISRNAV